MLRTLFSRKNITKLSIIPPKAAEGRAGIALVLIVRNEERHIAEWARFHLAAGADFFVVYDNGCTDDTIPILRQLIPEEQLSVIPWDQKLRDGVTGREIHNQVLAYAHAIRNFGPRFRWMACIDADEFLVPVQDRSLGEALEPLKRCPNVSLPWHNFGRCGHQEPPEGGVIPNYTQRAAHPASGARGVTNFKVIIDPVRVTAVKVHSYETDGQTATWNDAGKMFNLSARNSEAFYSSERLQLNHYYTRSEQELAAKIARGSNQTVNAARHAQRVRRNVANIEAETVEDRSALKFLERIGGL
ncbi:glycosyltransferase family 92 protein [Actibacterium pelagium]|uniref:Glycosyl transferase family 92 n=1 Tax=Actibacterium pelagium TaxID=2029103 RepID=A0A917ABI4_9RHOB|nr:glycosyltransferase family 92 protein [Actibacterium pelagium]GGE40434.1 hypothetical protein GCM10011517_05150 [Actibacterium pelagium]